MLDAERALAGAVFDHLRADAALTAVLGSPPRIYDQPPSDVVYPYLTLGRSRAAPFGGIPGGGVNGEATEHTLSLSIFSRFDGTEEARQIAALARASLDDAALTPTDHRLVSLRVMFSDVFRAADWRTTFAVLRLRAVTEPLS